MGTGVPLGTLSCMGSISGQGARCHMLAATGVLHATK